MDFHGLCANQNIIKAEKLNEDATLLEALGDCKHKAPSRKTILTEKMQSFRAYDVR